MFDMRVFISWSGTASQELAKALAEWLPTVLQAVDPFMSDNDIEKGERWSDKISSELEQGQYGIICLTPENKDATWLHFEAGALSKVFKDARVAPLLFDLSPSDIRGPLVSFQCATYRKDEVRKLLASMNTACPKPLATDRLEKTFEALWSEFDANVTEILERNRKLWGSRSAVARKPDLGRVEATVEEILAIVRENRQETTATKVPTVVTLIFERTNETHTRARRSLTILRGTHSRITEQILQIPNLRSDDALRQLAIRIETMAEPMREALDSINAARSQFQEAMRERLPTDRGNLGALDLELSDLKKQSEDLLQRIKASEDE
jgi:hypothetical protein